MTGFFALTLGWNFLLHTGHSLVVLIFEHNYLISIFGLWRRSAERTEGHGWV
jgi:hypothetical protein